MPAVRRRKREMVASFRGGSERRIEQADGVELLRGEATFAGPKAVTVHLDDGDSRQLTADFVLINTGARPAVPAVDGVEDVPVLDSTSIMELDAVPEHLLVLGGGYVALEFAQLFCRFGSRVTIVQRGAQLLGREDADVAEAVADVLREDGVEVLLQTEAVRAQPGEGAGAIQLTARTPDGERTLTGSHLLAATGRTPNTDRLDPVAGGVAIDGRGYITVNDRLETSAPGVYAMGDVTGGPAFTHVSYDDYRILRASLVEGGQATRTGRIVPYVVFTDPQLGRVGLSEREAREQGRAVRVARMPMVNVARALETDEPRGFMKAVVDDESDQILGCAILGLEGGELMAMLQIAMMGQVPYTALRDGVFAHPTLAESFNNLFASLDG